MPLTLNPSTHRCGLCLQEFSVDQFAEHGLGACLNASDCAMPSAWMGANAYDLFCEVLTTHDGWQDLVEELSEAISSEYFRLTERFCEGNATEAQEDRIARVETRAEQYLVLDLIKRLCATYGITKEDLL